MISFKIFDKENALATKGSVEFVNFVSVLNIIYTKNKLIAFILNMIGVLLETGR